MDAGIIINPISGSRRRQSIASKLKLARDVLRDCALDGEVVVTQRAGHARELARSLAERGAHTVVAWGGDGSINEVASEIAFGGPALGIVPAGSGNGLARELKLPWQPRQALTTALQGALRWIDAGELGGRLFFNVAGIGFDAHLARLFNARSTRGFVGYFISTLGGVLAYEPSFYSLKASDVDISQTALIVALANSRQYGNNAQIAPFARVDDGLLELVVLPSRSTLAMVWGARRLFTGTLHKLPGVTMQSVRSLEIVSDAIPVFHVDGEVVTGSDRLTARVHPKALQVRVPSS